MLDFSGESKKIRDFFIFFVKKKSPSSTHLKVWGFRAYDLYELIDDILVVVVPLLMQLQKFNLWSYSCRDM